MREGDYVQVTRRFPPHIRRGKRGTVEHQWNEWALVRFPNAMAFEVPKANLVVIDHAQNL